MSGAAEHNLRDAICRSPTCTASALLNGRESDQVTSAIDAVRLGQPKRTLRIANPAWVPCVCGVVVLQIALILHHEPFVDEWQALQIAVQSPDLASMLANLRYEGHPPLWYLLLRGLAMVVGPQAALPAASLIFALASQCLILFRAPFPRWLRLALVVLRLLVLLLVATVFHHRLQGCAAWLWGGGRAAWGMPGQPRRRPFRSARRRGFSLQRDGLRMGGDEPPLPCPAGEGDGEGR